MVELNPLALRCGATITKPGLPSAKPVNVILLLGWLGCQDRFLSKYSKLYEDEGHTTVRVIVSPYQIMLFSKRSLADNLISVLKLILKDEAPDTGVLIHAFSNGGALVYEEIVKSMSAPAAGNTALRARLRGVIFDSAPARLTFTTAWRALTAAVPSLFARLPVMLGLVLFSGLRLLLFDLPFGRPSRPASFWRTLAEDPSTCPQLFIYSPADEIVAAADVEDMRAARAARGVAAAALRLDNSPHVGPLRIHPGAYAAAVRRLAAPPPPPGRGPP